MPHPVHSFTSTSAQAQVVDLEALRELAWSGIPAELRPVCWQLLLGYLPPNRERRCARLFRWPLIHPNQVSYLLMPSTLSNGRVS